LIDGATGFHICKSQNMKQGAKTTSPENSSATVSSKQPSFFTPGLKVNQPNDTHEQEADRIAGEVMQKPSTNQFFTPAPAMIQREEKDKEDQDTQVLTEGGELVYDQLLENNPRFVNWKEKTTERLKLKYWDSQPKEFKASVIGYGLLNLGILTAMFGGDRRFRDNTFNTFEGIDVWKPINLLVPYSEYFPVSGFKYKLPSAENAPSTHSTEFNFDAWFDLMSKKRGWPKISVGGGLESSYDKGAGDFKLTGGSIKLKLGGGIVKLDAFVNTTLPPIPTLVIRPGEEGPTSIIMRSFPDQLSGNLPKGYGVFFTIDVVGLSNLLRGGNKESEDLRYRRAGEVHNKGEVYRKENSSSSNGGAQQNATSKVNDVLSSGSGKALEGQTKSFMENRFGQDFSDVRIHTNQDAAQSAQSINANAYTAGKDIVFDTGQYQPNTDAGKNLLAHELVHVVQQTGTIQRKKGDGTDAANDKKVKEEIGKKLEAGNYEGALADLNNTVGGSGNFRRKKEWLKKNEDTRKAFLSNLAATNIVEEFSAAELMYQQRLTAFFLIDCWYQSEEDKKTLYDNNMPLFDHLLTAISPYTGTPVSNMVELLINIINSKQYKNDYVDFVPGKRNFGNAEFHTIHLLAPTTERKFKFYKQHDDLWQAAKKKFDPFTGITKGTMEFLTDTNDMSPKEALAVYNKLKVLPEEQRLAFMDTALFAGGLELNKDAEAYYEKRYKSQYKALPHNWDFALRPWIWDAPFAERLTIDHVALMSEGLNYEDKSIRKFGFDRGIDVQPYEKKGVKTSDATRLIEQLQDDTNFNNIDRLVMLLAIGVRAHMEAEIRSKVLIPKSKENKISKGVLPIIESYGFKAAKDFAYEGDKALAAEHDKWMKWYFFQRTALRWHTGEIVGDTRLTADVYHLQEIEEMRGNLGGMRFGYVKHAGDDYYNNTWLNQQVSQHPGSRSLLPNVKAYQGNDRTGKVYVSVNEDIRQANIYASVLPIEGLNYFYAGVLYRAGDGVLQGLSLNLSWTKDPSDADNEIKLSLSIDNFMLKHLQLVSPRSTLAIGEIAVKGLNFTIDKNFSSPGWLIGLFRDVRLTMDTLLTLLPSVMKMVPMAIMTMTEEFKGPKVNAYKGLLGAVMTGDFATLRSSLSFTSAKVTSMYDTMVGFLDDISIEKRDEKGNLERQILVANETLSWQTDAISDIKGRIQSIDNTIRSIKAAYAGVTDDKTLEKLEIEKKALLNPDSERSLKYETKDKRMARLLEIYKEIREATARLDAAFENAVNSKKPGYNALDVKILQDEKAALEIDLNYIENYYFSDRKRLKTSKDPIDRFEIRQRTEAFESKYKSVDVRMQLSGITLKGGNYVRDMLNDLITTVGFVSPTFEGLENINIGAVHSGFTASGKGASELKGWPGASIQELHIPLIKAPSLFLKTEKLQLKGNSPRLDNIWVGARVDFVANPLDRDPEKPFKWRLSSLKIEKALFNGLQLFMGNDLPLLDFPAGVPVELWGIELYNFYPTVGNINLRIRDVKAQGAYQDKDLAEKTNKQIDFGVDTTLDNDTEAGKKFAIAVKYNKEEDSILSGLNIASAFISSLNVQSPTMQVSSLPGVNAVEAKNIKALVKVFNERKADDPKGARPLSIEVKNLHIGEVAAQGINLMLFEEADTKAADPKKKTTGRKVQEVSLPKKDKVFIRNIKVSGLRVTLDEGVPSLSTTDKDASVKLGQTDLSNLRYSEKSAKGSVLRALALHSGKFDAFTLEAVNRNGRDYSLPEFLKFFGRTRLEGLDAAASYNDGKISGSASVKGKKNVPISIDYHEPTEEGKPGYYSMRLALSRINIPALRIEQGDHQIIIPKPADILYSSNLSDVDVKLRAYVEIGEDDKVNYDIYLDSLDVAQLEVFGMEYHNKKKGIDVVFDKNKPLFIPNIKAGGFRLSSAKGFGVFGKAGGWANIGEGAASIEASFDSIKAALENGEFLSSSYSRLPGHTLEIDIASMGFHLDSEDNMSITLNNVRGGFPNLILTQTDATTGIKTTTTVHTQRKAISADKVVLKLNADKSKEFDVTGLAAGDVGFATVDTKGSTKLGGTSVLLDAKAIGADSVNVKLNADNSKEITLRSIYAGNVFLQNVSPDGKSKIEIKLPDPNNVLIDAVHINIDAKGNKKVVIERPTIRKFNLRKPSQEKRGDYINVVCDLVVDGKIEMGDGNFASLTVAPPYDAFVLNVPDSVPVQLENVKLEYKNTVETPPQQTTATTSGGLTADQQKLLELEKPMNEAKEKLDDIEEYHSNGNMEDVGNPEHEKAKIKYLTFKKAYDDHKAKMIGIGKAEAASSMTRKYLDAVQGNVQAYLLVYGVGLPLNIETYNGEKYIEIDDKLAGKIPNLIMAVLSRTASAPFWKSKEMKKIGEALKFWYTTFAPGMRWVINKIADGRALEGLEDVLRKIKVSVGPTIKDPNMFGFTFNIENSLTFDTQSEDEFSISLVEMKYKHPVKPNYFNLFGFVEYFGYVSPPMVSIASQKTSALLKRLPDISSDELDELEIGEVVDLLVAYIQSNLSQQGAEIGKNILSSMYVKVNADVSLMPQQVLTEILKEKKLGTFTFDKGKQSIDDIHISGEKGSYKYPETNFSVGGGPKGADNIIIPGATYISEDKGTKIIYDALEIAPLNMTHHSDVLTLMNKNMQLKGLKVGVKKKK
jgi:hypothetical protein